MTISPVWEADKLQIRCTVTKDDAQKDFSTGSVDAAAQSIRDAAVVTADAAVIADDGPGAATFTVDLTFAANAFRAGVWNLQVQVTLGDAIQTVAQEAMTVQPSFV